MLLWSRFGLYDPKAVYAKTILVAANELIANGAQHGSTPFIVGSAFSLISSVVDIQGETAGEPLHVPTVAIECSAEASRARDCPLRRYIDEINIETMREAVVATV